MATLSKPVGAGTSGTLVPGGNATGSLIPSNTGGVSSGGGSGPASSTTIDKDIIEKTPQYVVTDINGNKMEYKTNLSDEEKNAYENRTIMFRNKDTGQMLTNPTGGVSVDKESGTITVKGAQYINNKERFKEITDRMKLNELSSSYQVDPDFAYPVNDPAATEGESPKEYKTVEGFIDDLNKTDDVNNMNAIQSLVQTYANTDISMQYLQSDLQAIAPEYKGNIDFADDDVIIYNTSGLSRIDSNWGEGAPTTIPIDLAKKNGVDQLSSYKEDENKKTATFDTKDFMENYYNRQLENWEEHTSDTDDIRNLNLFMDLKNYIQDATKNPENADSSQVASAVALYKLIAQTDPICSFWQGAGDVSKAFAAGTWAAITDSSRTLAAIGTLVVEANWATKTSVLAGIKSLGDLVTTGDVDYGEAWTDIYGQGAIGNITGAVDDFLKNNNVRFLQDLNVSDITTPGILLALQAEQAEQIKWIEGGLQQENQAVITVEALTRTVLGMAANISIGNAIGKLASAAAAPIVNRLASAATSKAASYVASVQAGTTLESGMATLWSLAGNKAKVGILNFTAKALEVGASATANVLGDTVVGALGFEQDKLLDILSDPDLSDDARSLVGMQMVENAWGYAQGLGIGKALMVAGHIPQVQLASRGLNRAIWAVSSWLGDKKDRLRLFFSKSDTIEDLINSYKSVNTQDAKRTAKAIRELHQAAVKETKGILKFKGKTTSEIVEEIAQYDTKLGEVFKAEKAFDLLRTRGLTTAARLTSKANPVLNKAYTQTQSLYKEMVDMAKARGMKLTKSLGKYAIPADAVTYIENMNRLAIARQFETAIKAGKDLKTDLSAVQKEITIVKERIATSRKALQKAGMLQTAQSYILENRRLWAEWNNQRAMLGLIDKAELDFLRDTGLWGNNGELYVGQMRKVDAPKRRVIRTDQRQDVTTIESFKSYTFGSDKDFVDPMLTFQNSLVTTSYKLDRKQIYSAYSNLGGSTRVYDAEAVKIGTEVSKRKNEISQAAFKSLDEVTGDVAAGAIVNSVKDRIKLDVSAGEALSPDKMATIQEAFDKEIGGAVDTMLNHILDPTSYSGKAVADIAHFYAPEAQETASTLIATETILHNDKAVRGKLAEKLDEALTEAATEGRMVDLGVKQKLTEDTLDAFMDEVQLRFNTARAEISTKGEKAKNLVNYDGWNKDISDISKDISNKATANDIIFMQNDAGELEMVKVSPLIADLMTSDPINLSTDTSIVSKINYAWMKMFRGGTTGWNPASWVNQQFRDFQNAWLVGGATKSIVQSEEAIASVFGSKPAYYVNQLAEDAQWEVRRSAGELADIQNSSKTVRRAEATANLAETRADDLLENAQQAQLRAVDATEMARRSELTNYTDSARGEAFTSSLIDGEAKARLTAEKARSKADTALERAQNAREGVEYATQESKLAEALAKREISIGGAEAAEKIETATSLSDYRRARNLRYTNGNYDATGFDRMAESADKVMDKLQWPNNKREKWLRQRVYANQYADAVKRGLTLESARAWADFYSTNATTNFSRAISFMGDLQGTIPYLRASVNGTKSFWRLWQIDPIGITSRIGGGLVVPMVGLMTMSLSSEENRQVYKNIKEYQKENSIAFVVDGQAFFVPIPQELSAIINPIRQIVEGCYSVNTNSFWQLAASDLLALAPIDLSGFMRLDATNMFDEDEDWTEYLWSGTTKLASQILPKWASSAIAWTTNRDLYTGFKIDSSRTVFDSETGEELVMGYTAGKFAELLHTIFPGVSARMAQNILENTLGKGSTGIADFLTGLIGCTFGDEAFKDFTEEAGSGFAGLVTSPLTGDIRDEADAAWSSAFSQLYDKKESLMAGDLYQSYLQNRAKAKTPEQIAALDTQRQNSIDEFYNEVKKVVTNLQDNYGRQLTQAQFAAVISVMNMQNTTGVGGPRLELNNEENRKLGKDTAIATMERMGFPSAGADSIFGRVVENSYTGEFYVEYNTPLAILNYQRTLSRIGDNLGAVAEKAVSGIDDIFNKRAKMYDERGAAFKAKDYDKADEIVMNYNSEVVEALKPMMSIYDPAEVIDSDAVIDYLNDWIIVPSDWETDNRNRWISASKLNKQDGFIKSYLKYVFGVK